MDPNLDQINEWDAQSCAEFEAYLDEWCAGDAQCNFCNGPMPCYCEKPSYWQEPTETEIKRQQV